MPTLTVPPPADSSLPSLRIRREALEPRSFLPFDDELDLEDALRGFVAAPGYREIPSGEGETAWSVDGADWMLDDPDRLGPELRRRVALTLSYGLYEVVPNHIYQVRGFDLANMTFVRGDRGWVVFDPLTLRETSAAAYDLVRQHIADLPVTGVIYSHGEPDDEGGARGVADPADVGTGMVEVVAPAGYHDAEKRGLGPAIGAGPLPATVTIDRRDQEATVDGVRMVFRPTGCMDGAPELDVHLPELGAVRVSERLENHDGVAPTPPFDGEAEVMFAAHRWPHWDADRVRAILESPPAPC